MDSLRSVLDFEENNNVTLADQALSLVSDAESFKSFTRENGCINCLPKHLKKKFSDKAILYIFKDGTSVLADPKAKNRAFAKNAEETLDFLKAKPSKNEMFFKMMQLKKKSSGMRNKFGRSRLPEPFEY